jgi:hypothetical protein
MRHGDRGYPIAIHLEGQSEIVSEHDARARVKAFADTLVEVCGFRPGQ